MRIQKRTLPVMGCALLGGLLVFGLTRSVRSPAPLDRAQAVAQTTGWLSEVGNPFGFPLYFWSGENDLTYLGTGHDGAVHAFRRSGTSGVNAAGVEGPMLHLNGGYLGRLSPDGKWLVEWHQNKLRQRVPTFIAMDGTARSVVGQPTWGSEGAWSADSRAMLSAVWRSGAAADRYTPDSGQTQKIPIPGLEHFFGIQCVDPKGRIVGFQDGGFLLNFGSGTGARLLKTNYPNMKLARVDPAQPNSTPEQWSVRVPGDLDTGTALLSPAGDRILWILHGDTTPAFLQRWRRYLPAKIAGPAPGYRWLVSGLHGEDMHEVAAYRYQPDRKRGDFHEPYSRPRWMPDGKHISFIFHNTLYTRPVD